MPSQPSVLDLLQRFIAEKRAALDELEAAVRSCAEHLSVPMPVPAAVVDRSAAASRRGSGGRRATRVAPGSVPDRILQILGESGEPTKLADLIDGAKARPSTVKQVLKQLVNEKRVVRTGATISLRYSLPGKAARA